MAVKTKKTRRQNSRRPQARLICTLKDISFSYGKKNILENINLEIPKSSFVCLVGESGAGKSTLLYILAGLLRPDIGTYFFENMEVHRFNKFDLAVFRRKNIGILFQDFRLLPFLNMEQNIKLPLFFLPEKIMKEKIIEVMQSLKILHRRKAFPKDISGGEAQRTAIARAIILKPKILLLDEPTGNLDKETGKRIIEILHRYKKKEKITIVAVSHSEDMIGAADHVWEIKNKKVELKKKKKK